MIVLLGLLMLMSTGDGAFYMGAVTEYHNEVPVLGGFLAYAYDNPAQPTDWDLLYSSTAFTGLTWIVLMVLAIQLYSKEYQTGTIKLSIAYGKNRFLLFLSKFIVIISYFGLLFYTFNLVAFIILTKQQGYALTIDNILTLLKLSSLYFMVLIVFTLLCLTISTLSKNTVGVSTLTIVFMFSIVFMPVSNLHEEMSIILKAYIVSNPMYYLWNASSYWAKSHIIKDILVYFAIANGALLLLSNFLLNNVTNRSTKKSSPIIWRLSASISVKNVDCAMNRNAAMKPSLLPT